MRLASAPETACLPFDPAAFWIQQRTRRHSSRRVLKVQHLADIAIGAQRRDAGFDQPVVIAPIHVEALLFLQRFLGPCEPDRQYLFRKVSRGIPEKAGQGRKVNRPIRCQPYFKQVWRRAAGEFRSVAGRALVGSVEIFGSAIVLARYSKTGSRPDMLLAAWIDLLFAASVGEPVELAVVIGRDETIVLRVPDDPAAVLESLLSVYEEGQIAVLPFACKSSFAYAMKALAKVRDESQRDRLCITAARGAWNPSRQNDDAPPSESEDEAMRLAFAGEDLPAWPEFAETSLKVFKPLLEHREEAP